MTSLPILEPATDEARRAPAGMPALGAEEAKQKALVFKALADPNRLRLLSIVKAGPSGRILRLRPHRAPEPGPAHGLPPPEDLGRCRTAAPRKARHVGLLLPGARGARTNGRTSGNPVTATEQAGITIRSMRDDDWPAVQRIYREGIATGHATFEAEVPDWERFTSSPAARPPSGRRGARGRDPGLGSCLRRVRPARVCRRGRTLRLRGPGCPRQGSRGRIASGPGRIDRAVRDLDHPGQCFPRKRSEPKAPPRERIRRRRRPEPHRPYELRPQRRAVAGYGADRAPLPGRLERQ